MFIACIITAITVVLWWYVISLFFGKAEWTALETFGNALALVAAVVGLFTAGFVWIVVNTQ